MIPQRNLSLLSNRLARGGGRRIPEAVLERDYCLAWFLIGLSRSSLCEHLVFNSHTFYLAYEGPLPAPSPKEVKVDITMTERFVLPLEDRTVLRCYDEYSDLTDDSKIRVYALNEIGVEKVVALTDRARNEPRDLYDVWYLTSTGPVDLATLMSEIDGKLEFRGRSREMIGEEFKRKEARYKELWSPRLGSQLAELPPFEDVFPSVRRSLRAAKLIPRT